jgi:hypothetical protein
MKRSSKWAIGIAGIIGALGAGFVGGHAWAGGIPTAAALTYSGLLQDAAGTPLTGTQYVEVKFWNDPTAAAPANLLCDTGTPLGIGLVSGRFSLALPDKCTTQVGSNAGIWAEVLVGPSVNAAESLGRAKIGAVPFAIEANHAVNADSATSATSATTATTAASANAASGALATTIASLAPASSLPKVTAWAGFPATSVPAPALTTANGTITTATTSGYWRRIGDMVQMRFESKIDNPGNATGEMDWALPAGYLSSYAGGNVGTVYVWNNGTSIAQICQANISSGKNHLYAYCVGTPGTLAMTATTWPAYVDFDVSFPVQGWTVTGP